MSNVIHLLNTGVVGTSMPRYCLFGKCLGRRNCPLCVYVMFLEFILLIGDTINVASRMESTGEGKRVLNEK